MDTMLRIGSLELSSRAMLAPMAGVCDSPFKRVVRRFDRNSLLSTEIVNADALLAGNREMRERLRLHPDEHPAALQIAGHEPEQLARAAVLAQEAGADLVDINCGCPSPQLVRSGNGAALLKHPERLARLYEAVRKVTTVPMTVKMRLGWDDPETVLAVARIAENCGADAIWVHGRTAVQQYRGLADWKAIAEVKRQVHIPVIGNGDILTPEDGRDQLRESGVDAVAVGRGAMGNPWIFSAIDHLLRTGERLPDPDLATRLETLRWQCRWLVEEVGEARGILECRKHVGWYLKGLPDAASLRMAANQAATLTEIEQALDRYLDTQPDHGIRPREELVGTLVDAKWQRYR